MRAFAAVILALILGLPALGRPGPQWANQPEEIRQWFRSVMQPDNPVQSCCGEADAFEVEMAGNNPDGSITVRIIDGKGIISNGQEITVARSKLQTKYGNPTDKFILFMGYGGRVYCLIPKVGT